MTLQQPGFFIAAFDMVNVDKSTTKEDADYNSKTLTQ